MNQDIAIDTKKMLKEITRNLVVSKGIVDFSMRKLAAEANCSLGTIYYHYPSKSNLIIEIVDELWIECFNGLDLSAYNDFLGALAAAYEYILHYFLQFKHNWMGELSALPVKERESGKEYMQNYMLIIRRMLGDIVDKYHDEISEDALRELGSDGIVDFIFVNFMTFMRNGQGDIRNLLFAARKVLL